MRWTRVLFGSVGLAVVLVGGALVAYELTAYRPVPVPRADLALVGGTVLTGNDLEPTPEGTVLVRDGVIVDVGPSSAVEVPSHVTTIDVAGRTVMPGSIDLHVHLGSPDLDAREGPSLTDLPGMFLDAVRYAPGHRRAALEHGVKTVRNVGDEHGWITDLRREVQNGTIEGPRVLMSGPLFTTSGGHPIATFGVDAGSDLVRVPTGPAEARGMVRTLAIGDDRVDVIKVVQERGGPEQPLEPIPVDVLGAMVDEAHANGLPVTAHWGTVDDLEELLDAGVDGREHLESRDLLDGWPEELLAEVVERDVPFTATLVVAEAALPLEQVDDTMDALQQRVGELHAAGGRIVVGSDAARPGVRFGAGVHRELELLVGRGMTPHEALLAATVEAARVLGDDRLGAIAPGHAADVIVIGGDPTADIGAIRNVMMTLRDGRVVFDRRDDD